MTVNFSNVSITTQNFESSIGKYCIITLLWTLIEMIGNPLLFGLIQFERYQGDPLKRRIIDQLLTSVYFVVIIFNLTSGNLFTWSAITDIDLNIYVSYFAMEIRRFTIIFAMLVLWECAILRTLLEYYWKKIPPMEQEFTISCLNRTNILLSFQLTIIGSLAGNNRELFRLQGISQLFHKDLIYYTPRLVNFSNLIICM